MKHNNVIDMILDENCTDLIVLTDENNKQIQYEQIALIPYDKNLYSILVEKTLFDQGAENVGEVFLIDQEKQLVEIVNDVDIISSVFEIYDKMFEEKQEEE